ncbi:MAG: pyridoxal phosphate-dependent aminotransferase family protein [Raineya sp.]|nr:pyridoxal phosphate-dependent aminotransferase family protein [Raineya sp.]MDW8295763.1 pyridoxal phosphate-dependent aminotransferase family protein [Raineya sp.]
MSKLLAELQEKLQKRQIEGNFRVLKPQSSLIDFSSNDYLGLARNITLQANIENELKTLPQPHLGATGSRLLSGTHPYVLELEAFLAQIFQAEACLLFNSGYQLNTAILATIPQKNDTILCDELLHASLREGKALSFAQSYYFRHNDLQDLEKKIQKAQEKQGNIFVVVESVYSMDGDIAPLHELVALCKQYEAYLIVDEAHSTGIYGSKGEGYCISQNLHKEIFARIYTFGKAIGGHGACVAGSKILIEYLINFARAFIYTTALPLHSYVHIRKAFEYITQNPHLQENLHKKVAFFREKMQNLSHSEIVLKESYTPIQILKIGGNERTKLFAQKLQEVGFDVRPVLSPTVKAGEEIIRICLHAFNTYQEIEKLCENILILASQSTQVGNS